MNEKLEESTAYIKVATNIDMQEKLKLVRITTVPISLKVLLKHQLKFMSQHFNVLAVSSPDAALQDIRQREGVATFPILMTRAITPLQDLSSLYQLYKLFKKEKPAIVHTHTPKAGLLGMIAGKLAGVPLRMHTVAGLPLMESKGIKRKLLEAIEKLTYSCATKVYPNSKILAQFILNHKFCKIDKIKVLGNGSSNGIDTEAFNVDPQLLTLTNDLKTKYNVKEDDFVFVFVGRLVKDKGIEELVNAFIKLKTKFINIKLLLVGPFEPELDPVSEETQKYINTDNAIIHVGFQQDVRPYLMMAQVLTFPSYREGFPNVPMQAGCLHLPSIVTDINGCNEIIEDGKNGLIIPAKDETALQKAMVALIQNKNLYHYLKSNARQYIVDRYDQKYFWNLLLNEYKEQIKKHVVVS